MKNLVRFVMVKWAKWVPFLVPLSILGFSIKALAESPIVSTSGPELSLSLGTQSCNPIRHKKANFIALVNDWIKISLDGNSGKETVRSLLLADIVRKYEYHRDSESLSSEIFLICDKNRTEYAFGIVDIHGPDGFLELEYLITHPRLEGKGAGAAVLKHAMEIATLNSRKGIILRPTNEARAFYLRHGFSSKFGERQGEDGMYLVLPVSRFDNAEIRQNS